MAFLNVLTLLLFASVCDSHKILFLFALPAPSHNILATRLYTELANAGHDITLFTSRPQKTPPKNVKQISVAEVVELKIDVPVEALEDQSPFENARMVMNKNVQFTEIVLKNPGMQKLLHSDEKFDLVFIYRYVNDALLGIAHHFKAPVILFKSMNFFAPESFILAQPISSSYAPNMLTPYTGHMTFWQRFWNSYYDASLILYYNWFILPQHRELAKKYIPGKPDLYDFLNDVSLILMNTHPSSNDPLPQAPNTIEIGGFHVQEPKKLPEDLQNFLDNSKNGVVYFSLGSISRTANIAENKRNALIKSFSKLKENVLWKFEEDPLADLPKNIKQMKWLPQNEVLAHPNVKAFISHGGLLSTLEAIHYGVPIIGIPIFVDQKMNIASAEANGYAIKVPFQELSEEKLSWALDQILNNPKYKNAVTVRSKILRDRPMKPMDSILYWINYVVRHKGAPHLRYPGMDLPWYQRHLLDVAAVAIGLLLTSIVLIFVITKRIKEQICKPVNKRKKNQ